MDFEYVEWSKGLVRQLSTLSQRSRVVFAASCAEQLVPTYVTFSEREKWGDVGVVRGALDMAWEFAKGSAPRGDRVHDMGHRLEIVAPNLDEFGPILATAALKAVGATYEALSICTDPDPTHALRAADDCREAVAGYLYALSDPSESDMYADPLMHDELDRQEALLDLLKAKNVNDSTVRKIRDSVGGEWAQDLARRILEVADARSPSARPGSGSRSRQHPTS